MSNFFLSLKSLTTIVILSFIFSSCGVSVDKGGSIEILTDETVVSHHRLPNFSYAGYNHGVGKIPAAKGKVIDVTDYGVIANDEKDDSKAMLKALVMAHKVRGPVIVQLPKGKVIISDILKIKRSDIVLRGAGIEETNLHFPRPLQMIDKTDALDELREYLKKYDKRQREKDRNIDELFSEYSWSGGFIWVQKDGTRAAAYLESKDPEITALAKALAGKAGMRNVSVSNAGNLKVGDVVELQWLNRSGENGPLLKEMYGEGDTGKKIGSHHWTFPERPLVRQKTKILEITGNTVTISDPLLHEISAQIPAQFAQWDHLTNVGIENLHISFPASPYFGHHLERGYNGIYMTSVFDGWIRDVTFENADSGILSYNSANLTISNIETTGDRQAHYSVHAGNVHNVLIENLTVNNAPIHSLSLNTQSTKCVFKNAVVNRAAVLDQHAGANHQNLFDNITLNVDAAQDKDGPYYPVWDGSGAGYWQPGHGRYNTTWNLKVNVRSGADSSETVSLRGLAEGPDARIIGVSGNREFDVNYLPVPYMERINGSMKDVPSLYDYQLSERLKP